MEKKYLIVVAIIVMVVLTGAALYVNVVTKENPGEKNMVIASGHSSWSPIMWRNGLQIEGAGVDITRAVFMDLGVGIDSRYVGPWDIVQDKARTGEIDIIVALYKTEEREKYLVYSIPYTTDPIGVFVKKESSFTYVKMQDLVGLKGVATVGDSYGQTLDDFILSSNLSLKRVSTPEEAFGLVRSGQVDYFLYASYSGEKVLAEMKAKDAFKEAGIVSSQNFYIGVSRNSEYAKYMDQINASLQRHIDNGDVARAIGKYNR